MRKNYDFCQKHRTISFLNKKIIIFAVHNKMQITLKGKKQSITLESIHVLENNVILIINR